MVSSRRLFLLALPGLAAGARSLAAAGQGGLAQFAAPGPPCKDDKPTPAVSADRTFRAGSPMRTSLAAPGVTGAPLILSGAVVGLSCGRITGAVVDFWQADGRGVYDVSGFRLRGRQLTDGEGRYRLETVMPGASAGRAPHIGVNVRVQGKANFWTEIFLPNRAESAHDPRFRPELVMQYGPAAAPQTATFDIILDI